MTVGATHTSGLYESTLFQNKQKNESQNDVAIPQNDTMQPLQAANNGDKEKTNRTQEESSAELSTEKIVKMVKEFEMRLLEQMGYAPASIAKIKNLTESYRLELFAEMKKEFATQMQEDFASASKTLSGLLSMPTNSKLYLQELLA